ncbi:MAG: NTP transferase domain-containing protein [Leptospiraceae bacterium]|nr:NTP transferase domain-containing protein [Leptospiraceae bacterium]
MIKIAGTDANRRIYMGSIETVCLVQARSTSSRLPGKVYRRLPEGGLTVLEHCIRRLEKAKVGPVYALIPHDDSRMQAFLEERSLSFIAGPLDDVRARFSIAAGITGARWIVRATADNPCVDPEFVARSVEEIRKTGADLFAYTGLPLGAAVEVFASSALQCQHGPEISDPAEYREHVSLHIKHHPEIYRVLRADSGLPKEITSRMRLTVDEERDMELMQVIFGKLGPDFRLSDLLELFAAEPEIFEINADVQQRRFPAHLFAHRHSA